VAESILYPRLPPAVARHLFDASRGKPPPALRAQARTEHPDAVFAALGGVEASDRHLATLAHAVRAIADDHGFPHPPRTQDARDGFDLACARELQEKMHILAAEAAVIDVWAFIGAVLVPDVCFWRFPDPPDDRVIGPDLTRHTLARLWWRAYQLEDVEPDGGLTALIRIPENEMNQLFERRTIGGNRTLVRAAARVLLRPDERWSDVNRRLFVRDALARLLRLLAFQMLEALPEQELEPIVRSLFAQSADILRREDGRGPGSDGDLQTADESAAEDPAASATVADVPPGVPSEPKRDFDDLALGLIPAQIAEVVNDLGGLPETDLVSQFERRFNISVKDEDHDTVRKLAWSAKGRGFITLDEGDSLWLPGDRPPGPIEQLQDWTIAGIYARACELLSERPDHDPFDQLIGEVWIGVGRIPRLVMSLVGRIINRARRDLGMRRPRRER